MPRRKICRYIKVSLSIGIIVTALRANSQQRRPILALVAVLGLLGSFWAGCSIEKHYDVLSFFFDGVPDPNAPVEVSGVFARNPRADYIVHEPFAEGACQNCHTDFSDLTAIRNDSGVCLQCHASSLNEYAYMHAPVVTTNCLWCHNPHQSPHAYLLRAEPADLCGRCHTARVLGPAHRSQPAALFASCLDCHAGHGGSQPLFLLPNAPSLLSEEAFPGGMGAGR